MANSTMAEYHKRHLGGKSKPPLGTIKVLYGRVSKCFAGHPDRTKGQAGWEVAIVQKRLHSLRNGGTMDNGIDFDTRKLPIPDRKMSLVGEGHHGKVFRYADAVSQQGQQTALRDVIIGEERHMPG